VALYTYECKWCGEFDAEHPATAPKGASCPECGRHSDHRLIAGRTGIALKGSGWYRDGYASTKK
jgi:putative FmdB family regulatory protein